MTRVECPTCQTSYTLERLGLKPVKEEKLIFTVVCPVCREAFDGWMALRARWFRDPEVLIETQRR